MQNLAVVRFTHNFIVYDGGTLPAHYRGKLFGIEPLFGRVVESEIRPDQSTFQTRDIARVLTSDDPWFRPLDIKVGPDGAIYLCDWYDRNVEHVLVQDGKIEADNGCIYRLNARGAAPAPAFEASRLSTPQLIELLGHPNIWCRQTALRIFGDRKDRTAIPALTKLVVESTGQRTLEGLWALYQSGGLTEETALRTLGHADPFVRLWTARLLCDENQVSETIAARLAALARTESQLEVRNQLASSARRLPAKDDLAIVRNLLTHDEDATDNRMPLMLWWALESKADRNRAQVLALFEESATWDRFIVRQHLLERLMRRYAQAGTRDDLLACARLFALSPSKEHSQALMTGFEAAFQGRSLTGLPDELLVAMARFDAGSVALGLRQSKPEAIASALQTIADENAREATRAQYIGHPRRGENRGGAPRAAEAAGVLAHRAPPESRAHLPAILRRPRHRRTRRRSLRPVELRHRRPDFAREPRGLVAPMVAGDRRGPDHRRQRLAQHHPRDPTVSGSHGHDSRRKNLGFAGPPRHRGNAKAG